jgi:hypothetical protein
MGRGACAPGAGLGLWWADCRDGVDPGPTSSTTPAYGCRFSDPAAYAAAGPPSAEDTRRLFDPCPVS